MVLLTTTVGFAQELSESAEVSLEDYSDTFQEKFFEALKQKGIENYDRALKLLLECREIDGQNPVVDHELAKAYVALGDYPTAQGHALGAVNQDPTNFWYTNTLVDIMEKKGESFDLVRSAIPYTNKELRENLATVYMNRGDYENAHFVLKGLALSKEGNILMLRIQEAKERIAGEELGEQEGPQDIAPAADPVMAYRTEIGKLLAKGDFSTVQTVSQEAIEMFPLQPFFYYTSGMALNKTAKYREAAAVLESGLDYLLEEDLELAHNIHKELAIAYTGLGNSSKANMYLSKLKTGS
jgi:tetratricopeptide (TPR) repeat protein